MGAIGPGDWVEWIGYPDGVKPTGRHPGGIRRGSVYRVTEVGRSCASADGRIWPSLRVAGVATHDPDGFPISYPVAGFRLIYRPRAEFLENLLRKAHEPLHEPITEDV